MSGGLLKYPRTPHIAGSRLQPGDEDLDAVALAVLGDHPLIIEEKLDGANAGISFENGELRLQSRGHFLTGGGREHHFNLFKRWARAHEPTLRSLLGDHLVLYGEWLYAKHTIFYDRLPHYFLEFDIFDRGTGAFWSTERRHQHLASSPIVSVPVLRRGPVTRRSELETLITRSLYKSESWRESLHAAASDARQPPAQIATETDSSSKSEGLYLKSETDERTVARYKFIRASFLQSVSSSGSHWLTRPIIANRLSGGVDIFAS